MAGLLVIMCVAHVLKGISAQVTVTDGGGLLNLWQNINDQTEGEGAGCSYCSLEKMVKDCPLDVMFMLDMSDSVSTENYRQAREYTARQMQNVSQAFQGTRVGFIAFSNVVHTEFALLPRTDDELQQLMDDMQALPQQRYGTQLADALRRARNSLKSAQQTAQPLAPGGRRGQLIVLVSDGCQGEDLAVKREATQASLDHVAIVSVQLDGAHEDLLKTISVQLLKLGEDVPWSSLVVCPATFLPPVTESVCSDFVVAMDGSDSVRQWEKAMRDYLAYTAMRYVGQDNAMGVVVFGTDVDTQSPDTMIEPNRNKRQLAEQIHTNLSFPNSRGTGTTQAILRAVAYLQDLASAGGTPSVGDPTLVVITDGPALNPQSAREALARAVGDGLQVILVGVGDTLSAADLQTMAWPQSVVVRVNSHLDLFGLDLTAYLCQEGGRCLNSRPCDPGQIINLDTCECICRDPCPGNRPQNPKTCACQAGCSNQCSYPQVLNLETCQCETRCTNQCNYPQTLNTETCQCETRCTNQCNYPQTLNTETCQCETQCTNQCNYPQTLNTETCQCVTRCTNQCNYPQTLNTETCQCEIRCTNQCNYPQTLNTETCQCECLDTPQCSPAQTVDLSSCTCACPNEAVCNDDEFWNTGTCACEPLCSNIETCDGDFEFNPFTCQCECTLGICPPGQDLDSASCRCVPLCSNTCDGNFQLNVRTCQCEDSALVPSTPGPETRSSAGRCTAEQRCQNNQPAVQDCQGRCICQCDASLYAGFYCDQLIRPSLCDNCTLINGHYLAGVEDRCDMYVVCDGGRGGRPLIRECPPGTIFKQNGRLGPVLCDHPNSPGVCSTDPCRKLGPGAKYPHSRLCGRYWQCDANGRTIASRCCPPGEGFDRDQGLCVPDVNCPNDCDPNLRSCNDGSPVASEPTCPYKAVQDNRRSFYNVHAPDIYQSCAPAEFFDDSVCRCQSNPTEECIPYYNYTFDSPTDEFRNVELRSSDEVGDQGGYVGCFGGDSRIILYRFSGSGYYTDYFQISLRVRLQDVGSLGAGERMAVVSNGDCGGPETLAITADGDKVYFKVQTAGGGRSEAEVAYTADENGWLDIVFRYERTGSFYLMTGTVNGQSIFHTFSEVIGFTTCALQVGHGEGFTNLNACMDNFTVWRCKPDDDGNNIQSRASAFQYGGSASRASTPNRDRNIQNGGPQRIFSGASWNTQNRRSGNAWNGGYRNDQNGPSRNTQNQASQNNRNRAYRNPGNRASWISRVRI